MKKLNIDKDLLIKHRFWIGLGLSVPLSIAAILILAVVLPAEISKDKKNILLDVDKTNKIRADLRNADAVAKATEVANAEDAKKADVWKRAWTPQENLYLWPQQIEDQYGFNGGLFAVQIKVSKTDPGGIDSAQQFSGKITGVDNESIKVKGVKGEPKEFHYSASSRVRFSDETGKTIKFNDVKLGHFAAITYERWKYFNDPMTESEQTKFKEAYESYKMIDDIVKQVDPVKENGEGVVQLKGWPYRKGAPPDNPKFLTFVGKEWNIDKDVSAEAWVAMEDLWIQKELYRLIRVANDYVGKFQGVNGEKGGNKLNSPYRFENPYWDLSLNLREENGKTDQLEVDIRNKMPRRQRLDVSFMIQLHDTLDPEKVFIPGEPLAPKGSPGDSIKKTIALNLGIPRNGVYGIEQVLTWETAAVKRIDQILIGTPDRQSNAHRLFAKGVRPLKEEIKKDAGGGQQPGGGQPGGPGPGGPSGGPGGKALDVGVNKEASKGGKGAGGAVGVNGVQMARYLEVSEQSRRLPVVLALIVDQDHVDRVQTAFGNSKLRFLTTQVLLNRYPGSLRPAVTAEAGKGASKEPSKKPPLGLGKGPLGVEGKGPRQNPQPQAAGGGGDDLGGNFELVLYGIVTLYERYPPRGAAVATAAPAP